MRITSIKSEQYFWDQLIKNNKIDMLKSYEEQTWTDANNTQNPHSMLKQRVTTHDIAQQHV